MKGTKIVCQADPRGQFLEGVITDTSLPGTIMQIDASVTVTHLGRLSWKAASIGTDGKPALIAVLREDDLQGGLSSTAYVAGTRCFMYCPLPGEEVNVRVGEGAGTANTFALGDRLMVDSDAGVLIPESGSPVSVPFVVTDKEANLAPGSLVAAMCTGH